MNDVELTVSDDFHFCKIVSVLANILSNTAVFGFENPKTAVLKLFV